MRKEYGRRSGCWPTRRRWQSISPPGWHPRIDVDLKERQSSDIVKAVSGGLAEIGIISDAVDPAGLTLQPFTVDRLVLVTSRDDDLAKEKSLSFLNLLDRDFAGLAEGALHDYVEGQANRSGKRLKVRVRVRTFEGICRMAAHRVGIGIVPEPAARRCRRSMPIALVRLADSWATRRLSLCFRSETDLTPVAAALAAHLTGREPHRSVSAAPQPGRRGRDGETSRGPAARR